MFVGSNDTQSGGDGIHCLPCIRLICFPLSGNGGTRRAFSSIANLILAISERPQPLGFC